MLLSKPGTFHVILSTYLDSADDYEHVHLLQHQRPFAMMLSCLSLSAMNPNWAILPYAFLSLA